MTDEWLDYTDPWIQELEEREGSLGEGGSYGFFTIKGNVLGSVLFSSGWRYNEFGQQMLDSSVEAEKKREQESEEEADIVIG